MRYQICVSGAAAGETVGNSHDQAYALGVEIAKAGKTLLTGATVGLPHYAAMGFKSVKNSKGSSIGFSPASSYREHVSTYRLPTKEFDYINFTGMEYVGRDVHLVRSADAVITVCCSPSATSRRISATRCRSLATWSRLPTTSSGGRVVLASAMRRAACAWPRK